MCVCACVRVCEHNNYFCHKHNIIMLNDFVTCSTRFSIRCEVSTSLP